MVLSNPGYRHVFTKVTISALGTSPVFGSSERPSTDFCLEDEGGGVFILIDQGHGEPGQVRLDLEEYFRAFIPLVHMLTAAGEDVSSLLALLTPVEPVRDEPHVAVGDPQDGLAAEDRNGLQDGLGDHQPDSSVEGDADVNRRDTILEEFADNFDHGAD